MIQVGGFESKAGLEGQLFPNWSGSQIPSKLNFCNPNRFCSLRRVNRRRWLELTPRDLWRSARSMRESGLFGIIMDLFWIDAVPLRINLLFGSRGKLPLRFVTFFFLPFLSRRSRWKRSWITCAKSTSFFFSEKALSDVESILFFLRNGLELASFAAFPRCCNLCWEEETSWVPWNQPGKTSEKQTPEHRIWADI